VELVVSGRRGAERMSARTKTPTDLGVGSWKQVSTTSDFADDLPTEIYAGDGAVGGVGDDTKRDVPLVAEEVPKVVAISMKTPPDAQRAPETRRELPHIKLRALSEMSRAKAPANLGNLAPPYDAAAARNRTVREYIVWGSLAVILACGIALVVWFAAT
jgi:hypothetical protein